MQIVGCTHYHPTQAQLKKKRFPSVVLGKDISETFKDWPLIVTGYGDASNRSIPALNIRVFDSNRFQEVEPNSITVWCFGYKANNANVFGYIDGRIPFIHISPDKIDVFLSWVALLIDSSDKASEILCESISYAWFGIDQDKKKRNKNAINKVKRSPVIGSDFYGDLRDKFFALLFSMTKLVEYQNQLTPELARQWIHSLWCSQRDVFDRWSLDGEQDEKKYRQIVLAKNSMEKQFNSNKVIKNLKQIATAETEAA